MPLAVHYLGHSTVLLEADGARLVTDPVLTDRLLHLRRHSAPVEADLSGLDCVLISHLHHDHLHPASLRLLDSSAVAVVPSGGGGLLAKAGFADVRETVTGERIEIGGIAIEAVRADHRGDRPLGPRAEALGYVIDIGGYRVYFAGDTDIHEEMGALGRVDLALLPVWGWGTSIGEGHLDPVRAAEALRMIEPRVAIPIHWGTFLPIGTRRRHHGLLTEPSLDFERRAEAAAPGVDVRVLQPGEQTEL